MEELPVGSRKWFPQCWKYDRIIIPTSNVSHSIRLFSSRIWLRSIQLPGRQFPPAGLSRFSRNESASVSRWIGTIRPVRAHESGELCGLSFDPQRRPTPHEPWQRRRHRRRHQTGERVGCNHVWKSEQFSAFRPEWAVTLFRLMND